MNSQNIDFKSYEKDNEIAFNDLLDNGIENLNENSSIIFFNTCINLLNSDGTSITTKYKIIFSLAKLLSSQAKIELFINGNYLSQLPFKLFNAQEKILDIIYIITNYAPNGITNSVAHKFGHLITRFPRKCLNILSLFAERFQVVFNPWEMIDLLFKYCDTFINPTCVDDYISILLYLNSNFSSFREERMKHTWFAYCQVTKKCGIDFSKAKTYYAMCQLYELRPKIIKKCPFPENIPEDLLNPQLQKAVISLLLRCSPNQIEYSTIQALLKIKNKSCCNALCMLAENQECAKVLINDLIWLQEEIPTVEGTMQIFIKLLNLPYARYDLVRSPEVVMFLNKLVNNGNDPESVSNQSLLATSTFVRSLPINNRFVGYLSKEDFLSNYFNAALSRTEKPVVDSTLLLIGAVSKSGDVVELSDVCDYVKDYVINNDPVASEAAVNLSSYPRCAREFRKNGLADYFRKNPNIQNSNEFLSNYRKSSNQPIRALPIVTSLPNKRPMITNTPQLKQTPTRKQPKEVIKARNIALPEHEHESESNQKADQESENEKEPEQKSDSKRERKTKPNSESEDENGSESEQQSDTELITRSKSDLETLPDSKAKNSNDENMLSENSSNDSFIEEKNSIEKPSAASTPERSGSSAIYTSAIVSSPSASGVYDPCIPQDQKVKSSPIVKVNVEFEEEEEESSVNNNDKGIRSSKSDISDQSDKISNLKNRTSNSDDYSISETENINPSISPIKQKSAIPASPLNKSKIKGIASFGSFGNISDADEIKKSSSIISVDLPPPEQNSQNLLPDTFGGLSYIKQGSPPPKPRPSRNKE